MRKRKRERESEKERKKERKKERERLTADYHRLLLERTLLEKRERMKETNKCDCEL